MSVDFQRCLRLGVIFLLLASGCSTVDKSAADFSKAQKLRKDALIAAAQGDTGSAFDYINQAQVLQPRSSESPGLTPPSMRGPVHRAIAPAAGSVSCYNIGINRFSCF